MKKSSEWKLITVEISQIQTEESQFNWFPSPISQNDINSIEKYGIQLPFIVQEGQESKYKLVDGFKRLKWFKSVGDYFVKEKIIDASKWVPQHRERIFILAVKKTFQSHRGCWKYE